MTREGIANVLMAKMLHLIEKRDSMEDKGLTNTGANHYIDGMIDAYRDAVNLIKEN